MSRVHNGNIVTVFKERARIAVTVHSGEEIKQMEQTFEEKVAELKMYVEEDAGDAKDFARKIIALDILTPEQWATILESKE